MRLVLVALLMLIFVSLVGACYADNQICTTGVSRIACDKAKIHILSVGFHMAVGNTVSHVGHDSVIKAKRLK